MESAELTLPVAMVTLRPWGSSHTNMTTPLPSPSNTPTSSPLSHHIRPTPQVSISWLPFLSLSTPHHGFLFVSQLSGAAHHGDGVLGCL